MNLIYEPDLNILKMYQHTVNEVPWLSLSKVNPLKPSVVRWLHFECSMPCRRNLYHSADIRALRMSEIENGRLRLHGMV